ncbi:hypothetical protein GVN16_16290 [Emticicia sp. CRIBPO]|uniref:hypothetical protein n=1 Tax=Emticicia sp. CRIBPO TaxID=2683258 RepID=UPI0014131E4E|nr:hypothetical protein [Emticicia sp. CRIBPO]NBA87335.1 hypothetical protein [Emticicia sp. CRIBPO]
MVLYIVVSGIIIFLLGRFLFRQGSRWTYEFIESVENARSVNKLLLLLYYLFNAGLLLYSVFIWENAPDFLDRIIYSCRRIGLAVAILGVLHYQNLVIILLIFHFKSIKSWKI